MVRIRILRGQLAARLRSLRSNGYGGLIVVAAILAVSLGGLGGDEGPATSQASVGPFGAASLDAPETEPEADGEAAAASENRPAPAAELGADMAPTVARAGDLPASLLRLPESAESALVFDLNGNRMHVFERAEERLNEVGDHFVAVGKQGIDKSREGDEKTPVGIYFITSYIPGKQLPSIYGVGALPINYPNAWDRRLGRTGSGIWIHGTDKDEETLLPQSSRGCLTLHNQDFSSMNERVSIRKTPVIVADTVSWTGAAQVEAVRGELEAAVETWRRDWESLDTDAYLGHYAEDFRTDSMDLAAWTAHKRRVNAQKAYIRIGLEDLGIYAYPGEQDLFLVTFTQFYGSNNFHSRRWKHQYWQRRDGDWRIVQEGGS